MTKAKIEKIISEGESQSVEFKERWPVSAIISKVVCSFANTHGGVLLIGVNDDGIVKGLEKDQLDELQKRVSESNKAISPIPLISVKTINIEDKNILSIKVNRAHDQGYHTYQGAIYVRVGSTSQRLDGKTQLEYLRHKQILSFDESFDESAKIEDLDIEKIESYLSIRNRQDYLDDNSIEDFLITNKLAEKENNSLKIKNATILLFGIDPTVLLPQSEIKLVQFEGSEPVDILEYELLREDAVNAIEKTILFLKSKMSKRIVIGNSAKREEKYEYPLSVIREAVVNAITHRDYFSRNSVQVSVFSDRIEITSPGSLPSKLGQELFGTISVQRNAILYRFLRDYGYVEGLGTGVPRIRREMLKAGLPRPEFIFNDNFIRVILYNKQSIEKIYEMLPNKSSLNSRQKKAVAYLEEHDKLKAAKYAEIGNCSYATAVNEINSLISLGVLEKVGAYRGAYYILKSELQ